MKKYGKKCVQCSKYVDYLFERLEKNNKKFLNLKKKKDGVMEKKFKEWNKILNVLKRNQEKRIKMNLKALSKNI